MHPTEKLSLDASAHSSGFPIVSIVNGMTVHIRFSQFGSIGWQPQQRLAVEQTQMQEVILALAGMIDDYSGVIPCKRCVG
ncbi:uncharacterized protein PADG_01230 [Paracoccidioides brasiliensis Pb18]|uniref:Uncharacterized protein n=2 Tax=Paracoccidioides brasiliensis TaxID=121759 RepID=C1G2R4_PARBD|nr:uncharacterized protein PADG_01230 [Paracoccidioides brasiliensis Pb18]EEH45080.2 hypothetical protein PADG_01230 [Paracoccidioides brasiliensis Pb18]ODH36705.1 hypothetical protein ACO22_02717 [Paracoccidioides brasiliensis]ODH48385.1 hypothetical protein GX48_05477 [Paracoccidioides brasiliensis]